MKLYKFRTQLYSHLTSRYTLSIVKLTDQLSRVLQEKHPKAKEILGPYTWKDNHPNDPVSGLIAHTHPK